MRDNRVNVVSYDAAVVDVSSFCPRGHRHCSWCRDIGNLEREADEASKKLASILRRLADTKYAANYAHGTIVEKLPNEIISAIFCEAWNGVDPSLSERRDGYEGPQKERKLSLALSLSGVCRKWRAIALTLPKIWSDVHVFMHRQKGEEMLSILRDIIGRSKKSTLTIRMHSEPIDNHARIEQLQLALAILQKESERWRSLQMCLPIRIIIDFLKPNMDLSRIQSLYVHSNERDRSVLSDTTVWGNYSLQPQHLSLDGITFKNTINMCWNNTTHVVAHDFTVEQAMKLLHLAHLLTSLTLFETHEDSDEAWDAGTYSRHFLHKNLQHITYIASGTEDGLPDNIFTFGHFPELTRVDHDVKFKTDDNSLMDNLEEHSPPIEELTLRGSSYRSYGLEEALEAVGSTLTRLTYAPSEEPVDGSEFIGLFRRLATVKVFPRRELYGPDDFYSDWDDVPDIFLPRLEYLEFTSVRPIPWDLVPALFAQTTSKPHRRPLKQFIFHKFGNGEEPEDHIIPKKDLPPLVDLRKAGFDFQYLDYNSGRDLLRVSLEYHSLPIPT
ncbi:hypothetical protein D9613_001426 [Agrocybe pediades]|uniref:F-box domain-containing protein n=1 Tax=Agrocybe pediades TaxID=84607 RepID=A0A8H4R6Y3_9AGAR|nr:hypothetical protein D9613_001426 [Agrocybe pediades]